MTDLSSCYLQRWRRNHGAKCPRRHRAAQEEEDAVEDTGMDADDAENKIEMRMRVA